MAYKAPIWEDGKSPAISAENLNNLSQAAEGAQVLYGNSAPTSSTEGAVGQFYLVVVADSDGNYPLYQCVAITNGSYVWRDTRRIPDSITSMLGIPAPGTINGALNVLAHVGNLHVWQRVQTYADPVPEVPAGYNIGTDTFPSVGNCWFRLISASVGSDTNTLHAGDVVANKDGTLVFTTSQRIGVYEGRVYAFGASGTNSGISQTSGTLTTEYQGKFVKTKSGTTVKFASGLEENVVYYVPTDATVSIVVEGNDAKIVFSDLRAVTGYPYTPAIPAGTTTDYLTSTDRDAYPDQSAEGGRDAYYTLGDVVSGTIVPVTTSQVRFKYSTTVTVYDNGDLNVDGDVVNLQNYNTVGTSTIKGKYIVPVTTGASISGVWFISSDATFSLISVDGNAEKQYLYCDKMQPVTGHAAIPANTTITYLGQLGGGARIEVGSYVGTGTYGSSNPNSLTFGFVPKYVRIIGSFERDGTKNSFNDGIQNWNYGVVMEKVPTEFAQRTGFGDDGTYSKKSSDGKTLYWYDAGGTYDQYNTSGYRYYVLAIG